MARARGFSGLAALLAAGLTGAAVVGCDDGGSDGTLVIVNGSGGGTGSTGGTPPSGFTVVASDPGGGTILESSDKSTRKIAGTFLDDVTLEACTASAWRSRARPSCATWPSSA